MTSVRTSQLGWPGCSSHDEAWAVGLQEEGHILGQNFLPLLPAEFGFVEYFPIFSTCFVCQYELVYFFFVDCNPASLCIDLLPLLCAF